MKRSSGRSRKVFSSSTRSWLMKGGKMTPSTILWANGKSFLVVSCNWGLSIAITSLETKYLKVEGKHILIPMHGNPIPTQQQTHTSGNWTPGKATGRQAYALRKANHCLYSLSDLLALCSIMHTWMKSLCSQHGVLQTAAICRECLYVTPPPWWVSTSS